MSCQKHPRGLAGEAKLGNPSKKEPDMRGGALLRQQRRLKQATQFVHKDSADLLPLDQLRRLGTSKDLQPHNVIQRRLLGESPGREPSTLAKPNHLSEKGTPSHPGSTQPPKLQEEGSPPPQRHEEGAPSNKPPEQDRDGWKGHAVLIPCKVCTQNVTAKVCTDREQNLISRRCVERLGLVAPNDNPSKELTVDIELGSEKLKSKATITDEDDLTEFCLGLETLVTLKCCLDLNKGVLKTPFQEVSFLKAPLDKSTTEESETVTDNTLQGLLSVY
ncbi:nuclear receptor-interacting protein 2 [Pelodytes ibericus]